MGNAAPRKLLIIDDEPGIRRLVRKMLQGTSFTVLDAASAEEGLAILEKEPCDVVLTDLVMPGQEGTETCMKIRDTYPGTRVVVMSGARVAPTGIRAALKLGASEGLQKPFSRQELLIAIELALGSPAGE